MLDRQLEKFLELPDIEGTLEHSAQTLRADISYITSHLCTLEHREKRQIVAMAFVTSVIASLGAPYILDFIFPRKSALAHPDTRSDKAIQHIADEFEYWVKQAHELKAKNDLQTQKISQIQRVNVAVTTFSNLLGIATTDLRITGYTHPIYLDLCRSYIDNFRSRGLVNSRHTLAQNFATLLPSIIMTTELGKAQDSDTCMKTFILSRIVVSIPTDTKYEFVSKEYNHILIRDPNAPKHQCHLCPNEQIIKYDDGSVHLAGRCYEVSCGLNTTYFTLGLMTLTDRLQPVVAVEPIYVEVRCLDTTSNVLSSHKHYLDPTNFITPSPHCSVRVWMYPSMLKVGHSNVVRIERTVEDKLTELLPKIGNDYKLDAAYRDSPEAKALETKILNDLMEEKDEISYNFLLSDTIKIIIGTFTGICLTVIISTIVYCKCYKDKNMTDEEIRLRQFRLRPNSMVNKVKTD